MDLILFDENFEEIGPAYVNADIEIGTTKDSTNDMEISGNLTAYGIYVNDTEIGGIFESIESIPGEIPKLKGNTWRGLLKLGILEPKTGNDYLVVSGDANVILKNILSDFLGGLFHVPEKTSVYIDNYQFRYEDYMTGINKMLEEYGCKLRIYARKDNQDKKVKVYAEAVAAQIEEGFYNEDNQDIILRFTDNRMGPTHLICLGKGELKDRQRLDLYTDGQGKIYKTQQLYGFQDRAAVYEYTAADTLKELEKYGIRKFYEIMPGKKLEILESKKELEIGDIVRATSREDGISIESPVVKKIYTISGSDVSVEYQLKEE